MSRCEGCLAARCGAAARLYLVACSQVAPLGRLRQCGYTQFLAIEYGNGELGRQLTLRAALALRAGASLDHWRRPVPADAPPGQGGGAQSVQKQFSLPWAMRDRAPPRPPKRSCARRASAGGRSAMIGAHWRRDWARRGNSAAAAGPRRSVIRFGVARSRRARGSAALERQTYAFVATFRR